MRVWRKTHVAEREEEYAVEREKGKHGMVYNQLIIVSE